MASSPIFSIKTKKINHALNEKSFWNMVGVASLKMLAVKYLSNL